MQLSSNTILQSGKYRIIRVLGQGGFGITYLAENIFLGKTVAIKEFFPKNFCGRDNTSHLTLGTANNAETVEKLRNRFLKEAKNIAKLDHPGIVKIHDIFEENNTAYYVMDYVEGITLSEMVKKSGPLSEEKAIEYIIKAGEALEYMHSNKMTHFDVKPANIIVADKNDMPVLIDFGLSKQYNSEGEETSTLLQAVSSGFSPIELYNPENLKKFSPQSDVYSLGATLYYILSGIKPSICTSSIKKLNIISSGLFYFINKSMHIELSNRFSSISEFINSLKQFIKNDENSIILTNNGDIAIPFKDQIIGIRIKISNLIGCKFLISIENVIATISIITSITHIFDEVTVEKIAHLKGTDLIYTFINDIITMSIGISGTLILLGFWYLSCLRKVGFNILYAGLILQSVCILSRIIQHIHHFNYNCFFNGNWDWDKFIQFLLFSIFMILPIYLIFKIKTKQIGINRYFNNCNDLYSLKFCIVAYLYTTLEPYIISLFFYA